MGRYPEVDLNKVKRRSVRTRGSKVRLADLARVPDPGKPLSAFLRGLPECTIVPAGELPKR